MSCSRTLIYISCIAPNICTYCTYFYSPLLHVQGPFIFTSMSDANHPTLYQKISGNLSMPEPCLWFHETLNKAMWNLIFHQPPNSRDEMSGHFGRFLVFNHNFGGKRMWHHYDSPIQCLISCQLPNICVHVVNLRPSSLTSASLMLKIHLWHCNPLYPVSCPASLAVNTSKC